MLERENRESSTSVEREKRESGPSVEGETLEEPKTEELNFPLEEPVVGIAEHVESEVCAWQFCISTLTSVFKIWCKTYIYTYMCAA